MSVTALMSYVIVVPCVGSGVPADPFRSKARPPPRIHPASTRNTRLQSASRREGQADRLRKTEFTVWPMRLSVGQRAS